MRLQFINGKQKELISNFKKNKSLTWKQVANFLKLKEGKLKAYFDETSLIPEEIYSLLDCEGEYNKFILEKKEENWGNVIGGKNSPGNTKKIKLPNESIELAEFYGIMLGDGNSHKTNSYKKGTYMIRIVGDSRLDKSYLIEHVKPLITNLFDINVSVRYFKNKNAIYLECHSRELIKFLENKGFPPGDKIRNQLGIPDWIKESKKYIISCIRGLYDTDGSVYKLTNQNSYQICFTNYNPFLLRDAREGLISLGIICSKISKNREVYITKKSELRKFLKLISFSNDRHLKKVKMWNLDIAP